VACIGGKLKSMRKSDGVFARGVGPGACFSG
jgi:hypothetical protein